MMTMNMTKTHTKTVSGEMSKRYAQMSESRMREGAEVVDAATGAVIGFLAGLRRS